MKPRFLAPLVAVCLCVALPDQCLGEDSVPGVVGDSGERLIGVSEDMWIRLSDEPEHHMQDGFSALREGDVIEAVDAIKKAAVFIKIAENNSQTKIRAAIRTAWLRLELLSDDLADREVDVAPERLKACFSICHVALARHHSQRAKQAAKDHHFVLAGRYLLSSGQHVERAAYWGGEQLEADVAKQLHDAKRVGKDLLDESGEALEDLGAFLESMGDRVEQFGRRLRPHESEPAESNEAD